MDSEGETAVIPSELVQHSIAQAKTVNIETTLKVISSFIDWCILSLELLLFYLRTGKLWAKKAKIAIFTDFDFQNQSFDKFWSY